MDVFVIMFQAIPVRVFTDEGMAKQYVFQANEWAASKNLRDRYICETALIDGGPFGTN
jgi:hypothetical protein